MAPALLSSKLYIPPHRPNLVPRLHLFERLDKGFQGKLTLVSAPAGFGKTTLMSEWVRHCGCPVAWLSIDKYDNDLARFLTYLIAALQRIADDIGVDIQAALAETQSPQFEFLLTRLVNEIEVIPGKSIIVLDDYHLIDSKSVHDALNFLIEYLPRSMHLVISGRTDPPLPISRLRVRGDVSEIRTPELRFTKEEAATFLNDLMGFDLSPEDVAALDARTEGWAASLQLAALSMQGRDDWHDFITAFSGSHRYLIDYLVDEVMARHPQEAQAFLRRTSILERFCAPLCDAVMDAGRGTNDEGHSSFVNDQKSRSQEILNHLESSNLFLIPLDDERRWYRYHHLFGEFLEQSLREKELVHIPEFHRRASKWFETEGLVDEAIRHALAAGDMEGATRLVDGIAADLVVRRSSNLLQKWVDQLRPDLRQEYPILCTWHAWALLFLGQLDSVEPILEIAEANQDKAPGVPISGYITTVRAYLANRLGNLHEAIDLSEQALEEMSDASPDQITLIFRGAAVIWLGVNHKALGDLDRAKGLLLEAASLNEEAGSIYAALAAMNQSAELAVIQGQLHQAVEIYQRGFQMARSWTDEKGEGLRTLVAASELHLGLGTALYQINDLLGATPHIQRAVTLLELGEDQGRMQAYRMLAYLNQAEGDYEAAYDLLGMACAIRDNDSARRSNMTEEPGLEQLRILLSRAQPEMAHLLTDVAQRIESLGLSPDDKLDFSGADYPREFEFSDLARSMIALDRAAEALPLLEHLLEGARSMGRQGDEIRYLVLMTLALYALVDMPSALDYLSQALTLAESQGYVRIFVDEGKPMWELLNSLDLVSSTVSQTYVESLLEAFGEGTDDERQTTIEESSSLIEPLSERELEVLRLMAAGHRYKEVAEQLVISLNTVRHHTRNIYSKLNVNNRAQAIARAKELD